MANGRDLPETLFEALSLIVDKKIEAVKFDETVNAVVTDAAQASQGKYTVSIGNTKFPAYSDDTTYKVNEAVMVTIPQGDYDNQKIIIGRQINTDADSPIPYVSPFLSMIDITNNLIYGEIKDGIWANDDVLTTGHAWQMTEPDFIQSALHNYQPDTQEDPEVIYLWSSGNLRLEQGCTRLGIQAQFQTHLQEYDTIKGNYGLAAVLTFKSPEVENETFQRAVIFDSDEFFGNVYNFSTYYTQEMVYDISAYKNYQLLQITLYLYQRCNFYNTANQLIPNPNEYGRILRNIFVKDPYICLGHSVDEFNGDSAELLTNNSLLYQKKVNDGSTPTARDLANAKTINLRWIHEDSDTGIISLVTQATLPDRYEVRWYRYELGAPSADIYCGAFWRRYYGDNDAANQNGEWEITEAANDCVTNQFSITFHPRVNKEFERFKVLIIHNSALIATSNVIEFTNINDVSNEQTLIDTNALSIKYEDTEKGAYFLYDRAGNIHNSKDKEVRELTALFGVYTDINQQKPPLVIDDYTTVTWHFPESNTMIIPVINSENYPDATVTTFTQQEKVAYRIKSHLDHNAINNTVRLDVVKDGVTYSASVQMLFNTAGTSGSDYTLVVTWDNNAKALDLSIPTSSQDYALEGNVLLYDSAGKLVELPETTDLVLNWKDYYDNEVNSPTISYNTPSFANGIYRIRISTNNTSMNRLYILKVTLKHFGDYDLVACFPIALKKNIASKITEYILGPTYLRYGTNGEIDFDRHFYDIVARDSSNIYQYSAEEPRDIPGTWSMIYGGNSSGAIAKFLPSLAQNDTRTNGVGKLYYLQPTSVYFDDIPLSGVQFTPSGGSIAWTQPLFIYVDNYPSTTLNKWDGKSIDIDHDRGTIVARGLAAGKKESNNTFTGVVLGDWSTTDASSELTTNTGVYGFHQGAMAYALKDNGTMFIGKDGSGRIYFDGNTAEIYSASYATARNGMYLNLATGRIELKSADLNETTILPGYFKISAAHSAQDSQHTLIEIGTNNYYLQSYSYDNGNGEGTYINLDTGMINVVHTNKNQTTIRPGELHIKAGQTINGTSTQKTLMEVTSGQYYLQSYDFNTGAETGVKFDLDTGKLTGYQFKLSAGTGNDKIILDSNNEQSQQGEYLHNPLTIGQQFNVSWEGDVTANGGNIAGWYFKKPPTMAAIYGQNNSEYYGLFSDGNDTTTNYASAMAGAKVQLHPRFGLRMWNPAYSSDSFNGAIVLDPTKGTNQNDDVDDTYAAFRARNNLSALTNDTTPDHKAWPFSIATKVSGQNYYPTPFAVDWDGTLYSAAGTIGGWTIEKGRLYKDDIVLDSENEIIHLGELNQTTNKYPFSIDNNGNLTAAAGTIGGWYITQHTLQDTDPENGNTPNIKFDSTSTSGTQTLKIGSNFNVTKEGKLTANSGRIGGWYITPSTLQNTDPENNNTTPTVKLNSGGDSTIGGWTVSGTKLTAGSITLSSIADTNHTGGAYIDAPAYYLNGKKFNEKTIPVVYKGGFTEVLVPKKMTGSGIYDSTSTTTTVYLDYRPEDAIEVMGADGNTVTIAMPHGAYLLNSQLPAISITVNVPTPAANTGNNAAGTGTYDIYEAYYVLASLIAKEFSYVSAGQNSSPDYVYSYSTNDTPLPLPV